MKLSGSQVMKMQVYTASGVRVGRVRDISIDVDTGVVCEYFIKTGFRTMRTITRERVIRIESDRLIVEDRVIETESSPESVAPVFTSVSTNPITQDKTSS